MTHTVFLKTIVLPCMLVLCSQAMTEGAACASGSTQGKGRVNMQGSIINTPCAIETSDLDQTVDMGLTTVGEVLDEGKGHTKPFSLTLINCTLEGDTSDGSHFNATFDGPSEGGLFSIDGASGIGLQIADDGGNIAVPGKALPDGKVVAGSQQLNYTLRLVRSRMNLKAGGFTATLRFKVDYF